VFRAPGDTRPGYLIELDFEQGKIRRIPRFPLCALISCRMRWQCWRNSLREGRRSWCVLKLPTYFVAWYVAIAEAAQAPARNPGRTSFEIKRSHLQVLDTRILKSDAGLCNRTGPPLFS